MKLVLISGSLRHASMNSAMIRAAARNAEKHPVVSDAYILPLREIPPYDEDVETLGDPPVIAAAKMAVSTADGLLIATPEYNGALSGVLKNAIDWLSRPWGNSPLTDKPVATMSVAPGAGGARKAQVILRDVLEELGASVIPHDLLAVSGPRGFLDDRGEVSNPEVLTRVDALVSTLVAHCAERRAVMIDG